jgi:hypothetical protein
MGRRGFVVVAVCLMSAVVFAADSKVEIGPEPASAAVTTAASRSGSTATRTYRTRPWVHPTVSDEVAAKLDAAIDIANDRVARVPACAALFTRLGADPQETLESVLYLPASPQHEDAACHHALAHTHVHDSRTWVCRAITSISDRQAAMVLIHEALHHAGLEENPRHPLARRSTEINEIVSARCRL